MQERGGGRQGGERVGLGQALRRRAALVEAVARRARGVELGQRQRRRVLRPHERVEAHAVRGEQLRQLRPEVVVRDPPEVGDRALEPAERAGGVEGPAAGVCGELALRHGHEVDQRLTGDDDQAVGRHAPTVLFAHVDPRAGQLPDDGDLVDVERLLAAYRDHEPAEPVAFGTSGHRGTSLDGSFTDAHVVAISAAVCRYRAEQGIDGPLFLGRDTHALSEPACAHDRRGARRARHGRRRRRRRRLHADARDLARDPRAQPRRRRRHGGRDRRHAVAQPARRRRLQVQPAARRAGRHRRHRLDRARGQPAARAGARRSPAHPLRRGRRDPARLRQRLRRRPAVGDRHRRDPARGHPARGRSAGRRERRVLAGDRRAPPARAGDRQRRGRPDLPLRPARLGREDPDGLLVAVRDGAAARAGRPLRRRVRQRSGRGPPRHRHAVGGAAQPEPPPRRLHRLPVRRPPRLGPGRRRRQDARQLVDHRSRRGRPRAAAGRGPGRVQVVRRRAARRDARVRRRGERGRLVPAHRRQRRGAPTRTG